LGDQSPPVPTVVAPMLYANKPKSQPLVHVFSVYALKYCRKDLLNSRLIFAQFERAKFFIKYVGVDAV